MTVSSIINRVSYAGDDVTTAFSFPYLFLVNADLVVLLVDNATGVETLQVITTHYTVSGAGNPAGGTVTMLTAPASGKTLVVYRDPAATQSTDLVNNDKLPADVLEAALDRLTLITQRVKELVTRALRQPDGDVVGISALPSKVDRVSKFAAYDVDGDPIASVGPVSGVPVTAFGASLVDDATAADARTTLGLGTAATQSGTVTPTTAAGDAGRNPQVNPAGTGYELAGPLQSFRNRLLNGNFSVWQRAVTFTNTGDNLYTADRWRALIEAANVLTVTREGTTIPATSEFAAKLAATATNNNKFGFWQVIEGINIRDLRGKTITLSVLLKADASIGNVKMGVVEFTGTEDSVSGDPISAWGADGVTPTLAANYAFLNTPANLNVTTSYVRYSVTVTVGASATNLAVFIWNDDKTTTNGEALFIAQAQLEVGPVATPFEFLPVVVERDLCDRYYQILGDQVDGEYIAPAQCVSTTVALAVVRFRTVMRIAPTRSVSAVSDFTVLNSTGGAVAITSMGTDTTSLRAARVNCTVAAGLTAGNATFLRADNTNAKIAYTAEL